MPAASVVDSLSLPSCVSTEFDWQCRCGLSPIQTQIIQPFIRHIYAVDTFFFKRGRTSLFRPCMITCSQARRFKNMERHLTRDPSCLPLWQKHYFQNLRNAMMLSDRVPRVPTRLTMPNAWEDILTYLVFSRGLDLDR